MRKLIYFSEVFPKKYLEYFDIKDLDEYELEKACESSLISER